MNRKNSVWEDSSRSVATLRGWGGCDNTRLWRRVLSHRTYFYLEMFLWNILLCYVKCPPTPLYYLPRLLLPLPLPLPLRADTISSNTWRGNCSCSCILTASVAVPFDGDLVSDVTYKTYSRVISFIVTNCLFTLLTLFLNLSTGKRYILQH